MKRLLIIGLFAALAVINCEAYEHRIKNAAPFPIVVKVDVYPAPADYNVQLAPGQETTVNVLAWCTNAFEARYTGSDPRYSGFYARTNVPGITCRGYNAVVTFDPPQYMDPFNPLPVASSNLSRGTFRVIVN